MHSHAQRGNEAKSDRTYQFWQEGSHPEWIQNTEMLKQKVDYIHNNPVKRGYVDLPEHWRYSSARSYLDKEGLIEVCKDWQERYAFPRTAWERGYELLDEMLPAFKQQLLARMLKKIKA